MSCRWVTESHYPSLLKQLFGSLPQPRHFEIHHYTSSGGGGSGGGGGGQKVFSGTGQDAELNKNTNSANQQKLHVSGFLKTHFQVQSLRVQLVQKILQLSDKMPLRFSKFPWKPDCSHTDSSVKDEKSRVSLSYDNSFWGLCVPHVNPSSGEQTNKRSLASPEPHCWLE